MNLFMQKQFAALGGTLISAVAASLCCIGPLLTALLGASGFVAASGLSGWRPYLLVLTLGLLGLAWYFSFRKQARDCKGRTDCADKSITKLNKAILLGATVLVIALSTFPIYSGPAAQLLMKSAAAGVTVERSDLEILNVRIPTIDCPSCTVMIESSVLKQSGVEKAAVSFETKEGHISYNPSKISEREILTAIGQTGFKAEPSDPIRPEE